MPHVVILYTGNLESEAGMSQLCRKLADTMLSVRDEAGKQVFPTGGTRVYALPAPHFAVADGGARPEAVERQLAKIAVGDANNFCDFARAERAKRFAGGGRKQRRSERAELAGKDAGMAGDSPAGGLNRRQFGFLNGRHCDLKTVRLRQTAVFRLKKDTIPESLQAFKG